MGSQEIAPPPQTAPGDGGITEHYRYFAVSLFALHDASSPMHWVVLTSSDLGRIELSPQLLLSPKISTMSVIGSVNTLMVVEAYLVVTKI